ncbi:MAG: putative quinol monooxygenase [Halobacteriales archaeon]|nr:putative quinol monooxygenase [Halobacteriales archaeon]
MEIIHVVIPIKPARRSDAIELFAEVAQGSRAEPGCLEYRVATDIEDENVIQIFELYEDEDAIEAHRETDHYGMFAAHIDDLVSGEREVDIYTVG